MEGRVDQAIIDRWQLRRWVRGDGRPGRGLSLAEEDDDEYRWRMDDPPDDVIAAVMCLDERREKTAELSALCEDDHTQHECCVRPLLALMSVPPRTVALIAEAKFIARCGAVRIGGSISNRIAVKSLPTSSPPPGGQACRVLITS